MAGEAYSGSEYDVEQQMYQAMASKMQSDGVDVTAEEIAQTINEQSSPNPPEPSEKMRKLWHRWRPTRRSIISLPKPMLYEEHCSIVNMGPIADA